MEDVVQTTEQTAAEQTNAFDESETHHSATGLKATPSELARNVQRTAKTLDQIGMDLRLMQSIFAALGLTPVDRSGNEDDVGGLDDSKSVLTRTKSLTEHSQSIDESLSVAMKLASNQPTESKSLNSIKEQKEPETRKSLLKTAVQPSVRSIRPKTAPLYPAPKRRPTIIDVVNVSNNFNYDRYKRYKSLVAKAVKEQKVFTIIGGYPTVRNELIKRGWLERLWENPKNLIQQMSQHSLLIHARPGNEHEVTSISKLLSPYSSNFVWFPRYMKLTRFDNVQPLKSRMFRPRDLDFTLKEGLVSICRASQWFHIPGISELACPRSYRLFIADEMNEFMADFRFTGCTSLLAKLVDGQKTNGQNVHFSETGSVPIGSINFAIKRVRERIRIHNHDDIDGYQPVFVVSQEWKAFFRDFHSVCRRGEKFRSPIDPTELKMAMEICRELVKTATLLWPNVATDGFQDIWIMKQAGKSRGIGVSVMGDNLQICQCATNNKLNRYIVQKYLERPLLIYNTKFDIRQYFLVVGRSSSFQVWVYKSCYLKFSSQEFSLHNFHESVHLTNHFVQKNYSNSTKRSSQLPSCNMWSSLEFQNYLRGIGKPDAWSKKIYPSICQNIVAACRASYEEIGEPQRNCFEMVGGDFMITESLDSLLLEVNATPDMAYSTPVTKQICPECLRDVIKVVVDRSTDPLAPTGDFEMVYEIPILKGTATGLISVEGFSAKTHTALLSANRIYFNENSPPVLLSNPVPFTTKLAASGKNSRPSSQHSLFSTQKQNTKSNQQMFQLQTITSTTRPSSNQSSKSNQQTLQLQIPANTLKRSITPSTKSNQPTSQISSIAKPSMNPSAKSNQPTLQLPNTSKLSNNSSTKSNQQTLQLQINGNTARIINNPSTKSNQQSLQTTANTSNTTPLDVKRSTTRNKSRTTPPAPTPPPLPTPPTSRMRQVNQSRQVLVDLATRLRQKQAAYQSNRIRLISPNSATSDIQGLGDEVNRLMDLNETIERLLRVRNSEVKVRSGVVNEFLGGRQKKREIVW